MLWASFSCCNEDAWNQLPYIKVPPVTISVWEEPKQANTCIKLCGRKEQERVRTERLEREGWSLEVSRLPQVGNDLLGKWGPVL